MHGCDTSNDARLRCAERRTVAMRRTMHGCDMPDELPSISIDHPYPDIAGRAVPSGRKGKTSPK
jgi:hypothetical protein